MKRPNRTVTVVAALIAIVIVTLAVFPLFFSSRIAQRVQQEMNQRVDARVAWRDADLSIFRHFPNLSLTLNDLTAVGVGRFEGDTLAAVRHLRVVLDLPSVVRNIVSGGPLVIRAVDVVQPRLRLVTLEDGAANWDIVAKPAAQSQPQAGRPLLVSLRSLEISDASVLFDNRQSKLRATLTGFNQSLSGDFSNDRVVIQTGADAETASVVFAGIRYLNSVTLGLTADIDADLTADSYTLQNTELRLNDLILSLTGSARSVGDVLGLDIAFSAPSTDFRSILSLVPAVYAHDFNRVQTTGTVALHGNVTGDYGDTAFPAFAVNATVNDATFRYPDLPLPARSIFMDLALTNPCGSADSTVVNLSRFHMVLGQNPIDARLLMRTPISDPSVDARISGKLDLADVGRTIKLDGIEQLTGTIAADAAVRTRMSYVQKEQYDRITASGTVNVANVTMTGDVLPHPLTVRTASLTLAPHRAQLTSFAGTIGTSDIQASGTIDNLLAFVLADDTLRGNATVRSNRFNLDEWRSDSSDLQIITVPPEIDVTLDATVAELLYDGQTMTDARGRMHIKNQRVTLEQFQTNTLGGQIGVTGFYETTQSDRPTFDVKLKLTDVDIPSAFKAFTTVQMLAPAAQYATGTVTTDLHLTGGLGKNMMPLFPGLSGAGTLQTSQLVLHDFPAMSKLVDVTRLQVLNNPTLHALSAAYEIRDGRLFVKPFDVKVGGAHMTVAGSNGLDQSLAYTLNLTVPRAMLGSGANSALAGLMSKAGKANVNIEAAREIPFVIQLAGTVSEPSVNAEVGSVARSVAEGAEQVATEKASEEAARLREEAAQKAARLTEQAEQQAAKIRQEAKELAERVKQEGYRQADSLTAKAGSNPLLQLAAKKAADKLRSEADDRAAGIVRDADQRADSLVAAARQQAEKIGGEP